MATSVSPTPPPRPPPPFLSPLGSPIPPARRCHRMFCCACNISQETGQVLFSGPLADPCVVTEIPRQSILQLLPGSCIENSIEHPTFGLGELRIWCETNHRTTCGSSRILVLHSRYSLFVETKGDPVLSQPSVTIASGVFPLFAVADAADCLMSTLLSTGSSAALSSTSWGFNSSHSKHASPPVT